MTNDVTATLETKITLTVEQLEGIIRRVVREELLQFATQELFNLNKESPLCLQFLKKTFPAPEIRPAVHRIGRIPRRAVYHFPRRSFCVGSFIQPRPTRRDDGTT